MAREQPAFLTVAHIVRARGLRGEVAAEILTDFPQQLTQRKEVFLSDGRSAPRRVGVERAWLATSRGGQIIFQFEGCATPEAAEQLVGLEVVIPYEQRAQLGEGQYYLGELIGCEVWEKDAAASLGPVRDVRLDTGTPLLVVDTPQGELLIPLAQDICTRIDPAARRIEVALPEGLRDINA